MRRDSVRTAVAQPKNDSPHTSKLPGRSLERWDIWALAGVALMWRVLFAAGRPHPFVDVFSGTAIDLIKNHRFENPWVADWMR